MSKSVIDEKPSILELLQRLEAKGVPLGILPSGEIWLQNPADTHDGEAVRFDRMEFFPTIQGLIIFHVVGYMEAQGFNYKCEKVGGAYLAEFGNGKSPHVPRFAGSFLEAMLAAADKALH